MLSIPGILIFLFTLSSFFARPPQCSPSQNPLVVILTFHWDYIDYNLEMTEETGSDLSQTLLDVDHYTAYKNHRSILQHMVDMGYLLRSSTFSSGHYTSLEAEWMDDMRRVYEVYETYTPRSTVPNPNLPSPRLPWEICLHVVDYISDYKGKDERDRSDKEMLWSCCLTCRTFVGPGRRYLYKYVELDSYWILKSFIDIIKRNSHLQRLTTHLDLMTYEVEAYHYLFLHHQALSNLAKLTLHKMPMLNPRLLLDQRHPFHSVTDLDLSDCGFSSVLDLRRMIGNFFPNLSYLSLSNLLLGSSHVNLPNKWPRNVISLSELNIASILGDYGPITEWLASTPSQTSICNLHISPNQTRMLLSFGQGIEELEITSMSIAGEYDLDQAISLGPHLLPQLKTLHVYFRSDSDMAQFSKYPLMPTRS
ncbi:hypothetical protein C8Q75DRAFT_804330 [Abortiporus biennis]|nr:hypothetical protein C8Q75DRAFT_804330 [Abortiporus biennis]